MSWSEACLAVVSADNENKRGSGGVGTVAVDSGWPLGCRVENIGDWRTVEGGVGLPDVDCSGVV